MVNVYRLTEPLQSAKCLPNPQRIERIATAPTLVVTQAMGMMMSAKKCILVREQALMILLKVFDH